jgi:hypothetical protein
MQRLQDTQEPARRFAGELQGGEVHQFYTHKKLSEKSTTTILIKGIYTGIFSFEQNIK